MYRSNLQQGSPGATSGNMESMKRQSDQGAGDEHNGLSQALQGQYEMHGAEQNAKRQRVQQQGGAGDPHQASYGGGMGMGPSGSPHLHSRARLLHQQQSAFGSAGAAAPGGIPGGPTDGMQNNLSAASYFNEINSSYPNPRSAFPGASATGAFGGLGNFGPASGAGMGHLLPPGLGAGGANPFGDYGRLPPFGAGSSLGGPSLGGLGGGFGGYNQGMGAAAGMAGMNPMAGMAGASGAAHQAGMTGLPSANRRAQIMALMGMENELQQQEAAAQAKVNFQSQLPQGSGGVGEGMSSLRNTMNMPGLGLAGRLQHREPQDPDGMTHNRHQANAAAAGGGDMHVATFSTQATPALQVLPPVMEEGAAPHYSNRSHIPLGIDEDNNWLTEFQCFIRYDLIEVVQASRHADQGSAGNDNDSQKTFHQVGIRCRYCAHLHPGQRASRSSAFPSSIRQLYQSFTMMLRDHFEHCSEIPKGSKRLFSELKSKNSQGAYDSKQYWIYAAEKLGMVDSDNGIKMTMESQAMARRKPPFGTCGENAPNTRAPPKLLVSPEDLRITSDFLYTLMSQVQVVHLIESERVGKRKTLRVGLPGFGCRYCCHVGRCGLSRMFPLRRRMLPGKVNEIYEHFKRCTLFPTKEKELLERLKRDDRTSPEQEKEFFDRVWERLGGESEIEK